MQLVGRSLLHLRKQKLTDLLASLMRAMAIMILFLRKMRSMMMMTSTIARMITAEQRMQQIKNKFVRKSYRVVF